MFDDQIRKIVANHLFHLSIEQNWAIKSNHAISFLYQALLYFKFRLKNDFDAFEVEIKPPEIMVSKRAPKIVVGYDEILQGRETNKNQVYEIGCPKAIYSAIDSVLLALAEKAKKQSQKDAIVRLSGPLVLKFDDLLLEELCWQQERLLESEKPEEERRFIYENLLETTNFRALRYLNPERISRDDINELKLFLECYTAVLVRRKGKAVDLNKKSLEGVINEQLMRSRVAV